MVRMWVRLGGKCKCSIQFQPLCYLRTKTYSNLCNSDEVLTQTEMHSFLRHGVHIDQPCSVAVPQVIITARTSFLRFSYIFHVNSLLWIRTHTSACCTLVSYCDNSIRTRKTQTPLSWFAVQHVVQQIRIWRDQTLTCCTANQFLALPATDLPRQQIRIVEFESKAMKNGNWTPCRLCVDVRQCDRDWQRTKRHCSHSRWPLHVSLSSQLRAEETACQRGDGRWKGLLQPETGCRDEADHRWPSKHDRHPLTTSWTATQCPPAN